MAATGKIRMMCLGMLLVALLLAATPTEAIRSQAMLQLGVRKCLEAHLAPEI
jgi:hypothetical protein